MKFQRYFFNSHLKWKVLHIISSFHSILCTGLLKKKKSCGLGRRNHYFGLRQLGTQRLNQRSTDQTNKEPTTKKLPPQIRSYCRSHWRIAKPSLAWEWSLPRAHLANPPFLGRLTSRWSWWKMTGWWFCWWYWWWWYWRWWWIFSTLFVNERNSAVGQCQIYLTIKLAAPSYSSPWDWLWAGDRDCKYYYYYHNDCHNHYYYHCYHNYYIIAMCCVSLD